LRIATDKKTGRSRGFAFANFPDKESAEAAVGALAGIQAEGRDIKIDLSEPRPFGERPERTERPGRPDRAGGDRAPRTPSENSVFLGNLDFSVTEDTIKEMCNDVLGEGCVVRVRIATDRDTGESSATSDVFAACV
jgi:nucleolin